MRDVIRHSGRQKPALLTCAYLTAIAVAIYSGCFWVSYCLNEGCTHPADWFFHLRPEAQAAWAAAVANIAVVIAMAYAARVALRAPEREAAIRREEQKEVIRRRSMATRYAVRTECSLIIANAIALEHAVQSSKRYPVPGHVRDILTSFRTLGNESTLVALREPELLDENLFEILVELGAEIRVYDRYAAAMSDNFARYTDDAMQSLFGAGESGHNPLAQLNTLLKYASDAARTAGTFSEKFTPPSRGHQAW